MNATAALSKAFLDGKKLSIKTAFRDFGITNLPREVSRLIERPFGVELTRVRKKGKSRYGVPVSWFEYTLARTIYNEDGIKKMQEYIEKHTPKKENTNNISPKKWDQMRLYD